MDGYALGLLSGRKRVTAEFADPMLIHHSLNASEQREFASRMEQKQLKEFMTVCSTWR